MTIVVKVLTIEREIKEKEQKNYFKNKAKKNKSDNFTRRNRKKNNIAIAILEKFIIR